MYQNDNGFKASQGVCMHEFVYYFPDEAVLTDHCYWFGPWYWYY
jgi:hypothetical protein